MSGRWVRRVTEELLRVHGFTSECDCSDEAAPYEPCECCGTRVSWSDNHGRWLEDDMRRGCPLDGSGHCRSWTAHTPERCRALRARVLSVESVVSQ